MQRVLIVAALVAVCPGRPAWSQDGAATGWTPSVEAGAASDYLFRGVDQSRGRGEAFAGAQTDSPAARLGIWASNVTAPGAASATNQAEVDLYGGWLTSLEGFDVDIGTEGYLFSGHGGRPDVLEVYGRLARTLGPARFGASAHYAPVGEHRAQEGYAELNASYPITPKWTVSGALGHSYASRAGVLDAFAARAALRSLDDTTWNAGVSYDLNDRIVLELRWSDVDRSGPAYPSRVFATLRAKLF